MLTLADLLAIEEDLKVLDFTFEFDDFLLWPLIRSNVLLTALYLEYGLSNPHARSEPLSARDLASYITTTARENPFREAGRRSILMFASGITNVKRGETYFNRLHDHLALEFPEDTLLIEDSVRKRYRRPRGFPAVCSHDWIHIQGALRGYARRLSSPDHAQILGLIRFLKENFRYTFEPSFWESMQAILIRRGKGLKALHQCYDRLFDRLQPRIIFVEDGSYGARSYIFKWARAKGITTAELQHGLISANHPAYNYSAGIVQSPQYGRYLPEFLLTYGPYWNDQTNTSSQSIVIGDSDLSECSKHKEPARRDDGKTVILVVSSGGFPEAMSGIALGLRRLLPSTVYEIVFRPHPGEIPLVNERYSQLALAGIRMDLGTDPYESLGKSHVIAGEMSTVLFEALAFGKPVFAWDNEYGRVQFSGKELRRFKTSEELADLLRADLDETASDVHIFWEHRWRDHYRSFIQGVGGGPASGNEEELMNSAPGNRS
jgi:hypothetical protein